MLGAGITEWPLIRGRSLPSTRFPARHLWHVCMGRVMRCSVVKEVCHPPWDEGCALFVGVHWCASEPKAPRAPPSTRRPRSSAFAPPPPLHLQGAQPMPSHRPPDGTCQAQWHL